MNYLKYLTEEIHTVVAATVNPDVCKTLLFGRVK